MLVYTGVGSRTAQHAELTLATLAAATLRELGYTCWSGHADGMDQAFERGAEGRVGLFLPWPDFNGKPLHEPDLLLSRPAYAAYGLARHFHPAWERLNRGGRALHARNVHQVLGPELVDVNGEVLTLEGTPARPTKFVLCWTPDGKITGGTSTAIRVAQHYGIPVFNLGLVEDRERIEALVNTGVMA